MSDVIKAGILSAFMAVSPMSSAAEKSNDIEFNAKIKRGFSNVTIPIDCDLLGLNGEKTSEFVKSMGIWGHMDNVERDLHRRISSPTEQQKIAAFQKDLNLHGVTEEKVDNIARHCAENYL